MRFSDMPIRRKLTTMVLVTSVVVMLLMSGAFLTFEFLTIRRTIARQVATLGEITAANSTGALAFENQEDAREILNVLSAEKHIVAACLYDRNGRLFSRYPASLAADSVPSAPGQAGYRFKNGFLYGFQPVVQGGSDRLGTLYLKFETSTIIWDWLEVALEIGVAVMVVVFAVAYLMSHALQRQISQPILALAGAAKAVSDRRDYSVRAAKLGNDELGQLTEAFNQMLAQIQELNQGLEKLVTKRTAELEIANKELEAFSYSVSHDLRAPLRHVDGFASLLTKHAEQSLDERGRHLLTTISKSAKQMGCLIDDLLEFSRTGRTALKISDVDQDALVASIVKEDTFERNDHPVEWRVAALPRVSADPAMLRQVWANLLQNAVKYSGNAPKPVIEVGSKPGPVKGEHVFYVKDNGAGFDMRYVEKLFGVFQRLHAATDFEGTGIGLANVRRIITRHGGRTWAEGAVGEGATFYFSLPAGLAAANRTVHPGSNN